MNDQTTNKRKASTSPPHTPRQAPLPRGSHFFTPSFASPPTMPKTKPLNQLDYLVSPTPTTTAPPLYEQLTPTQRPTDITPAPPATSLERSVYAPPPPTTSEHPPRGTDKAFLLALTSIEESTIELHNTFSRSSLVISIFTPTPPGGFPLTCRGAPSKFFHNLHPDTARAWLTTPHPKFFIHVSEFIGKEPAMKIPQHTSNLRKTIDDIATSMGSSEHKIEIYPPVRRTADLFAPFTFLAHGAPQKVTDKILERRVWSLPRITFEAHPFDLTVIPSIILCLAGFTTSNSDAVLTSVKATWNQPLIKEKIISFLRTHNPKFDGETGPQLAAAAHEKLVSAATVEFIDFRIPGGIPSLRFNVYSPTPTSDIVAWSSIKNLLACQTYITALDGVGISRSLLCCTICLSYNHPQGLCPFPNIPEWNGPKHALENDPPRNRGRGRGRGGRGRNMAL